MIIIIIIQIISELFFIKSILFYFFFKFLLLLRKSSPWFQTKNDLFDAFGCISMSTIALKIRPRVYIPLAGWVFRLVNEECGNMLLWGMSHDNWCCDASGEQTHLIPPPRNLVTRNMAGAISLILLIILIANLRMALIAVLQTSINFCCHGHEEFCN